MYYKMKVCIRELQTGRRFQNMYLEKSPPITWDSCLSTASPRKDERFILWRNRILYAVIKFITDSQTGKMSKGHLLRGKAPQLTGFKPVWGDPNGFPVYPLSRVAAAPLWNQRHQAQNGARVEGRKRTA